MTKQNSRIKARTVAGAHHGQKAIAGVAAFVFAAMGGVAFAQQAQTSSTSGDQTVQLQEIVVTATRRSENIQKVPISVTAFTKAQMDIQGVKNISDIARLSPSLQFSHGNGGFGSNLGNSISIRGMFSGAGGSTTGIYINDTPIQVGATIASGSFTDAVYPLLFDIQRVEVLNGPQGVTFGSGSEGGAVRFITTPPNMDSPSVYARTDVSTTEYGAPSYEAGVAGGAPIIQDKLGFRASVYTRHTGGFIDHVNWYTGQVENPNNNYQDAFAVNFALGWQPIDGLMITPSIYFQHIKANGAGGNAFSLRNDDVTAPVFGVPQPVFQQPYGDVAHGDYVDLHQLNEWANQRFALPALKIQWTLPHNMSLFSNTSYFERKQFGVTDFGSLEAGNWAAQLFPPNPNWVFPGDRSQYDHFFTQEVRLQSTDNTSRLKWLVGAFYSDNLTSDQQYVHDPYLFEMMAGGPLGALCGNAQGCDQFFFHGTQLAFGQYSFANKTDLTEKQKALFGQASYRIIGGLSAVLGVRYADFNTNWVNYSGGPVEGADWPGPGGKPDVGNTSSTVWTPKYMLQYETQHTLTYISATKGFRNGGVNAAINNASCAQDLQALGLKAAPNSFNPDSLWSYELGSKFTLLDHKLIIDAAVYQYNWSNMINNEFLQHCTLSFTTNLGKAQGRGFELSVQYRPIAPLTLGMNAGYDYVKATQTLRGEPNGPGELGAIETENGDALNGSTTINANVMYNFIVMDHPTYFSAFYNYQGPGPFENNPNDVGSYVSDPTRIFRPIGYSTTNARLGMDFGNWDVSLYSDNILNAQPILGKNRATVSIFAAPTSLVDASTIRPRTSGITATYHFN